MTKEEAQRQYGEIELTFKEYYSYSVTFEAMLPDGVVIGKHLSGHDVANRRFRPGQKTTICEPEPDWGIFYVVKGGKKYDFEL